MTVIVNSLSDKKQQKEPLVGDPEQQEDQEPQTRHATRPSVLIRLRDRMQPFARHQHNALSATCVWLTALLLLSTALAATVYLYEEYEDIQRIQRGHYRGWCGVPVSRRLELDDSEVERFDAGQMQSLVDQAMRSLSRDAESSEQPPLVREEFDLDVENDRIEKIETPDFRNGRKGRFVHDFGLNLTAIVDLDAGRCFIMELNRSQVSPPKTMADMFEKMRRGDYDIDSDVIRESYRVITPAIPNSMQNVGFYINSECSDYPIYRLEKMTSPVFKRSIGSPNSEALFTEFAGKWHQLHLLGIENAPGKH